MNRAANRTQVLYVEDDPTIAFLTRDNLEMKGYEVVHFEDGMQALETFKQKYFDICVIDIMLPRMDGFSLANEIRLLDNQVPIIFLTARTMLDDKIRGFNLGADDYIVKPFSIEELVLRMEVFLRRSNSLHESEKNSSTIGEFLFDFPNQQVVMGNSTTNLTLRESELLEYLTQHKNTLVKREDLLKALWGDDDYFLGRSLDVFISRLRKILAADKTIEIENVHGVGFRFRVKE